MSDENPLEDLDIEAALTEIAAKEAEDKFAAVGTKRAHYSPAKDGPFACKDCIHVQKDGVACVHPEVIEDARELNQLDEDGNAIVEPGGCCEYQRNE